MSERPHRGPTSVAIDREVMDWLAEHRAGWLTWLADRLMDLGNVAAYVCTALCLLLFFRWGRRTPAVAAVLAGLMALLASDGFKLLFNRDRPPSSQATVWASGPAFPSSASTTTIAVVIVFVALLAWPSPTWRRRGVAIGVAITVLIGWAVMYLGAHWLTDVLAGWLLGALIAWAAIAVAPWVMERLGRRWPPIAPSHSTSGHDQ